MKRITFSIQQRLNLTESITWANIKYSLNQGSDAILAKWFFHKQVTPFPAPAFADPAVSERLFVVKKFVQKGLMMVAGLVTLPAAISHADQKTEVTECKLSDPRFLKLKKFFHRGKCPMEYLSAAFIREADVHHLDWRLLPSLSMIESGGGRASRGNNVFGWNNGNSSFASVREGIHFVAAKLAYSRYYRDKTVSDKLRAYNPNEGYGASVKSVMLQISNAEVLD